MEEEDTRPWGLMRWKKILRREGQCFAITLASQQMGMERELRAEVPKDLREYVRKGGQVATKALVQRRGLPTEDATWESVRVLKDQFPYLDLERSVLKGGLMEIQAKSFTMPLGGLGMSRLKGLHAWLRW